MSDDLKHNYHTVACCNVCVHCHLEPRPKAYGLFMHLCTKQDNKELGCLHGLCDEYKERERRG